MVTKKVPVSSFLFNKKTIFEKIFQIDSTSLTVSFSVLSALRYAQY